MEVDTVATTAIPLTAAQLMENHEKAAAAAGKEAPEHTDAITSISAASTTKARKQADILDVNSAEAFPTLGGGPAPPKPAAVARPLWITTPAPVHTNGAVTASVKATGQIRNETTSVLELQEHEKISKNQLKRGMADIGKDVGDKTGTRIQMSTTIAGVTVVIIKGRPEDVLVARRELMRELCPRVCRFGGLDWVQIGANVVDRGQLRFRSQPQ